MLLAIAELVRVRRAQAAERQRAAEDEERRRVGEQRLRLAQELHDVLAHNISLINVQASVALHLIDEQPEQARPALVNIKVASHDALQRAAHRPRRAAAWRRCATDACADACRSGRARRRRACAVASTCASTIVGPVPPLPAAVELAAYRIVQEALTNVTSATLRRTAVTVRLAYDDGVTIEVLDDGVGGRRKRATAFAGMRERARSRWAARSTPARDSAAGSASPPTFRHGSQ